MLTTRYAFEQSIIHANKDSVERLKESYRNILESDKEFSRKADYIGLSILGVEKQIKSIEEEIKELQIHKQVLKQAKEIAGEVGAEILQEYGLDKLEGAALSSITITDQKVQRKQELEIQDHKAVFELGYHYLVIDEESLIEDLKSLDGKYKLLGVARLNTTEVITPPKLRVNQKRVKPTSQEGVV
jgi:hypothetical protein